MKEPALRAVREGDGKLSHQNQPSHIIGRRMTTARSQITSIPLRNLRSTLLRQLPLLGILCLALTLRFLCAKFLTGTIDTEGAEYARIAGNLLNGIGYVGISTPGTELMFPPLFPWLIALVARVTHDLEAAGRSFSITRGALLVLPVSLITQHLYRPTTAYIAALLVACHPLLIGFAATVYVETAN